MRQVRMVIITYCTDEFFEKNMQSVVDDIKSGQFQREMASGNEGVTKVTATIQVTK